VIRSIDRLVIGDAFKIGQTPVVVTGTWASDEFRATHKELTLETLYSDGGRVMKVTLSVPKNFLVELLDTESQ
jgi:hypothetical protein